METPCAYVTSVHCAWIGINACGVYSEEFASFYSIADISGTRLPISTGGVLGSKDAFIVDTGVYGAGHIIITARTVGAVGLTTQNEVADIRRNGIIVIAQGVVRRVCTPNRRTTCIQCAVYAVRTKSIIGVMEAGTIQGIAGIKGTIDAVFAETVAWDVHTPVLVCTGVLRTELSIITCER
jgi:hypothetical protein